MQIRTGNLNDLDALLALEQASFSGDRLSRRQLRHHLRSPRAHWLLAIEDGALLGSALLLSRQHSSVGRIYSIAVSERARGRGVGAALLQAVERTALAQGLSDIRLEVREDNAAAQRLYARFGYQRGGRRVDYYEDGMAAQLWHKALASAASTQSR